jgi:hypothetical protein
MPTLADMVRAPFEGALEKYIYAPADFATAKAREAYPKQEWDQTPYNAMRHSAWVGGMRHAMGNNTLAGILAGAVGEANEMATMVKPWNWNKEKVQDTLLDLNNNRVGLDAASRSRNPEEMVDILRSTPMVKGDASFGHFGTPKQLRYRQDR